MKLCLPRRGQGRSGQGRQEVVRRALRQTSQAKTKPSSLVFALRDLLASQIVHVFDRLQLT